MIILRIVSLIFWLWIMPIVLGWVPAGLIDRERKFIGFPLVCGYVLQWFLFLVIALPVILLQKKVEIFGLTFLSWTYACVLAVFAILVVLYCRKHKEMLVIQKNDNPITLGKIGKIFLGLFWLILIIQVLGICFLSFADGDDAYYVAVATIADLGDTMYIIPPYTGGTTTMDIRHALAPMPMWIAFLARVTGMHAATIAHVAVPLVMLLTAYELYAVIGQVLCKEKREMMPLYLFISSLLILFGNYSMKTAETFLLTRTAQGKAILGNVIFPFIILLLLMLADRVAKKEDTGILLWVMLFFLSGAACLCSALGGVLVVALYGVTGFYISLCYKRWNILSRLVSCSLPALWCIALYLLMQKI